MLILGRRIPVADDFESGNEYLVMSARFVLKLFSDEQDVNHGKEPKYRRTKETFKAKHRQLLACEVF